MVELIPSKDVRELTEKMGRTFTDFEKAAIIYNLCFPYEQKMLKLMELRNTTNDKNLRNQLDEHMECQDQCLKLYAHQDTGYVYLVLTPGYEEIFRVSGCYTESDLAYFRGKKMKQPFMVEKYRLDGAEDYVYDDMSEGGEAGMLQSSEQKHLLAGEECSSDYIAKLCFNDMGELLYFYSRENPETYLTTERDGLPRFEYVYVDIPNPFDTGDWVRIVNKGKCGVVCTSQEKWKRNNACWKEQSAHFGDIGIVVRFCEDGKRVKEERINPLFLERVPLGNGQIKKVKGREQE